jgi:branched-chain amino acid transport system ATP-binding protein
MIGGLSLQAGIRAAGYGMLQVLRNVSVAVPAGDVRAILGANGAGKTTLLRALSGLLRFDGSLLIDGSAVQDRRPAALVRRGLSHVPERRGTFADMTVRENLLVAAHTLPDRRQRVKAQVERVLDWMPALRALLARPASSLSGGEQQMLAIGRGLMSDPKILLLDEPSLGLSPMMTERLFEILQQLNKAARLTILVVEQNAAVATAIASVTYVIQSGEIVYAGPSAALVDNPILRDAYLGA